MRKKLSLLVLLFVFTFFMSGSAYAVNVGNGTELDIEFNNITTSGTLTITTDTIVAVSSLTAAGKEVVFEGFQPGGTTIDLGNIYTFLNIETSTMTLNNISVTKSSGSAVVSSASYISASSSGTFDNNISYVSGGAFVLQNTSTAAFSGDFDFTNNTASTSGGAIYATNSFLDFTNANETNFTGNSAQGINWLNGGGAMFLANSTASFAGDSDFTNNTTSTSGGAIYANNSFLDFTNANETNFSGNTCGLGAGAIFLYGKSTATFSGKVNFSNNTGNTVNSRGGAVYVWSNSHLDFTNASSTTFNSNQAYGGGALYLWTNSTVIFGADTSFINNYASGASGDDSGGGAIHLDYAYMEAQDIKFINNKAANRGGALFLFDDSEAVFKGDTLFENNASAGAGGAIYIQGEYSKLHFTDTSSVTFRSNISVKDSGGALAVYSSTAIFDGAVDFIGNKSGKSGGALYSNAGETVFKGDTLFENNVSTGAGGAIYAESGSKLHFTDTSSVTFRSNTSVNNGGALAVHSSTAIFDGDVAFIDNKSGSSNSGGAIHAGLYSFLDFTNANKTTFTGNRSGTGMFVGGGAMYMAAYSTAVFGGEVNFLNNNNGNTSNVFGGAVFVSPLSYLDFTKASTTIFDSNQAYRGGALYIMNTSTAIFGAETVFRNNYASGAGGAIFNDFAYIIASEAENIKFIGNESSNNGGALYSNEGESIFKGKKLF